MESLAKTAYYTVSVVSALVITFFFLSAVSRPHPSGQGAREVAVALAAGVIGYGLLFLCFRLGHQQHQWLAGLVLAVTAPVAGGLALFLGLLVFGRVHWQ